LQDRCDHAQKLALDVLYPSVTEPDGIGSRQAFRGERQAKLAEDHQRLAVRGVGEIMSFGKVTLGGDNFLPLLAAGDVREAQVQALLLVLPARGDKRGQSRAVGGEGEGRDPAGVRERQACLSRGQVAEHTVFLELTDDISEMAAGGKEFAVGGNGKVRW